MDDGISSVTSDPPPLVDVTQLLQPITQFHQIEDFVCLSLQRCFQGYLRKEFSPEIFIHICTPIIAHLLTGSSGSSLTPEYYHAARTIAEECIRKLNAYEPPASDVTLLVPPAFPIHNPAAFSELTPHECLRSKHLPLFPLHSVFTMIPPVSFKLSKLQREVWRRVLEEMTTDSALEHIQSGAYKFPFTSDRFVFCIVFPYLHGRTLHQILAEIRYFLRTTIEVDCSWNPKKITIESNLVWTTEALRASKSRLSRTLLSLFDHNWIWLALYHPSEGKSIL